MTQQELAHAVTVANTLKLTGRQLGRRAGLYRLTATVAGGGGSQDVQLRIKRR